MAKKSERRDEVDVNTIKTIYNMYICINTDEIITFVSDFALTVAVRVELYRIANSPNSFPGPIPARI